MTWDDWFSAHAVTAAGKSKDPTQVGAALVSPDGAVILTGYNGPPRGVRDLPDRLVRPTKYLFAAHAEANLISSAARYGIRTAGCRVYVTHLPCAACARSMIQAGIVGVCAGAGTTSMPAEEFEASLVMLREAGVALRVRRMAGK
jgi:dCMP deaminase